MTKTPEELAEEYTQAWWGTQKCYWTIATTQAFLAGYRAAQAKATELSEIAWKQEQERLIERLRSKE